MEFLKNRKYKNVISIKSYIIIILIYLIFFRLNSYLMMEITKLNEIKNLELYLKFCNDSNIKELYFSDIKKFPKVSIISPIYNRGKYLLRFLRSVQNQKFNDIEIILIDDFSSDDTVSLIKQYQTFDKRIVLIKNKKNYGTFKSRNLGILKSKGKYLILPDPDDILSQDSLKSFYIFATKYNYEMIRFNIYIGQNIIFFYDCVKLTPSRPVFSPEIQTFLFYAAKYLKQIDFNVSNKFIKREALIRTLNVLSKEYLNMYITNFEDGILNFMLYRTIKSFYFLKKIGYYYIRNQNSISRKGLTSDGIKFIFLHLKFVLEFSKNNHFEKDMFNALFQRIVINFYIIDHIKLMKENIKFYINTIDSFLENEFVWINNKNYLIRMRQSLIKYK